MSDSNIEARYEETYTAWQEARTHEQILSKGAKQAQANYMAGMNDSSLSREQMEVRGILLAEATFNLREARLSRVKAADAVRRVVIDELIEVTRTNEALAVGAL